MSDSIRQKHDFLAVSGGVLDRAAAFPPLSTARIPGIPASSPVTLCQGFVMKKVGLCILAAVAFTPPAFAAQCLELRFLDEQGVLMPVNPPLIGIMVGDEAPLFEGVPPAYAKIEAGRMVPCPEALLASSRKAFEDFCTSDERRKKAAAANNVDMSIVNKRCTDLNLALTP